PAAPTQARHRALGCGYNCFVAICAACGHVKQSAKTHRNPAPFWRRVSCYERSRIDPERIMTSPAPFSRDTRLARLEPLLAERILVLDGAMGTMIQGHRLSEADFRGERFRDWQRDLRGNNDLLTLTQPEVIAGIHRAYLEAGADIVETNTFTSTSIAMADYGMEALARELNEAAARLARSAADEFEVREPGRPRYVAGVLGPTNRTASISPDVNDPAVRNVTFDELVGAYDDAAR